MNSISNRKLVIMFITISFCLIHNSPVFATEIYLKNGDKLTGEIIEENEKNISILTEMIGNLTLSKNSIDKVVNLKENDIATSQNDTLSEVKKNEIIWKRELAGGFISTHGNTQSRQLNSNLYINRNKKHIDEWTLKGEVFYSSSNNKMNGQKWDGMGRYAFSLGETKMWYNFYRIETEHDKFAHVDYRTTPATGLGYWFYDLPDTKLMTEIAIGWEHTEYNDATNDTDEGVLIPRLFFEKDLFEKSKISENVLIYPFFDNFTNYRLYSETIFTTSLTKKLSFKICFTDNYSSVPPKNTKHNNLYLITSLVLSF
ncbi:MAG: DUF481 domain-containing protein [bacterium]